jgi:hypothetical protein
MQISSGVPHSTDCSRFSPKKRHKLSSCVGRIEAASTNGKIKILNQARGSTERDRIEYPWKLGE